MNIELTEEQSLIRETAREFALAELGFMGLNVEEQYGGSEAGSVAFSVALTETGAGSDPAGMITTASRRLRIYSRFTG